MFQQINSPRPGNVYCSVSCSVTSYVRSHLEICYLASLSRGTIYINSKDRNKYF